jgi:hypothetical protein
MIKASLDAEGVEYVIKDAQNQFIPSEEKC